MGGVRPPSSKEEYEMCNVKECPRCSKTMSGQLGYCWDCWNANRNSKQATYHCNTCGIDITEREHENFTTCTHPQDQASSKKFLQTQQQLEHFDYKPQLTQAHEWTQLEQRNMELSLASLIDDALDKGEKEKFLDLAKQLKQLKEGVVNG